MPNNTNTKQVPSMDEHYDKLAQIEVERGRLQARGFIMELEDAGLLNKEASAKMQIGRAIVTAKQTANAAANSVAGAAGRAYGAAKNTGTRAVTEGKQLAGELRKGKGDVINVPRNGGMDSLGSGWKAKRKAVGNYVSRNKAAVGTAAAAPVAIGGGVAMNKKASANEATQRLFDYINGDA
jgi:hypothetical protein